MNLQYQTVQHKTLFLNSFFLLTLLVTMSQAAFAANPAHGKDLHNANCQSCHTSLMGGNPDLIYTRSDRRVNSIDGLRNQVTRCKTTVGVAWPKDQVEDVVEYLNTSFYKL